LEARLAPAVFTVVNAADSGPGSLRQAVLDANASPGADAVRFSIPGAGAHTVSLLTPLPAVTDPLTIDGSSQPGFAGAPLVELSGAALAGAPVGLWLAAPGSSVLALAVNRFAGHGLVLQSGGDVVQGCYVGTSPAGAAAGNGYDGVVVLGPGSLLAGNVVSGNGRYGIDLMGAAKTVVQGDYVGTNAAGGAALPNGAGGVALLSGAAANVVANNVVSGNGGPGLLLSGAGTLGNGVYANRVGTDAAGKAALANAGPGVNLAAGASYNVVGGSAAALRNVVSGNAGDGVQLSGAGTSANVVAGNYVGLNAAGAAALANGGDGVLVQGGASGNGVYGNAASGNRSAGVELRGAGASGNVVAGNLLGSDAAGAAAVPNQVGAEIDAGAAGNVVGGSTAGSANVLSGNTLFGVLITGGGTSGNVVSGDYVGTKAGGAGALGNGSHGAFVTGGASQDTLGSNVVADNGGDGVLVGSDPALGAAYAAAAGAGNAVLSDLIFGNAKLGIDLGPDDGVTANDSQGHSGPNGWQNFPALSAATGVSGGTRVQGSLHSAPSASFRLEFFASPAADPSGHGQAQAFLGALTVSTDGSGAATFDAVLPISAAVNWVVSATATDATGSTSELSADVVVPQSPPVANAGPNESGNEGAAVTFAGSATGGQPALSYSWAFGDGGTASGTLTPSHVYQEAGSYTATLTVTDSLGRSSQSNDAVTVKDVTPTASAGGPYSAAVNAAIAFKGSATDSPV
ncbi:MAG TPA: PKD domain-containing protein, partial [Gemmataceae bacterium]|nr:PKD domain-containing protein [Gemmataceae bacterium]